jgi:ATP-dependent DNA helicase RecQ
LVQGIDVDQFAARVMDDLFQFLADLAHLHGSRFERPDVTWESGPEAELTLAFAGPADGPATIAIRDVYLPVLVANTTHLAKIPSPAIPEQATCERLLHRIFGFSRFREGQYESVARAIKGCDAIVLLPTGGGKSIAYQLSALLRVGTCLVVDPLLSLIDDQRRNLRRHGIDRTVEITGDTDVRQREDLLDLVARGEYWFCYIAPERLQSEAFRDRLRALTVHSPIALVAIDEAHCVSEWGHDFRPSYLNVARIAREYCAFGGLVPPLLALTGTASQAVLKDIQRELAVEDFDAVITPRSFERPELHYTARPCTSAQKPHLLFGCLEMISRQLGPPGPTFFEPRGGETRAGLVFCLHVNGGFGVVSVARQLEKHLRQEIPFYCGTAPKGIDPETWAKEKRRVAARFQRDEIPLLVCTKAFGMGIDKPNVRYTIHYNLPPSIESFYQEAGRAGRDGQAAKCVMLFSNDHPERTTRLLSPAISVEELAPEVDALGWGERNDIDRVLWLHKNSFRGIDAELEHIDALIGELGDLKNRRQVEVAFDPDKREQKERAVHRLLVLGVVADYTIDHAKKRFKVGLSGASEEDILVAFHCYIAKYQRQRADIALSEARRLVNPSHEQFVRGMADKLVRFVYEVIERGRRRALSEMLSLCQNAAGHEGIRQGIEDYLGSSAFGDALDRLLEAPEAGLGLVDGLLEEVRSTLDAGELRGQVARRLESYPDHPALLLLRAASEALALNSVEQVVIENGRAFVRSAIDEYGVDPPRVIRAAMEVAARCGAARSEPGRWLIEALLRALPRRDVARQAIRELPVALSSPAVSWLVSSLNDSLQPLLKR